MLSLIFWATWTWEIFCDLLYSSEKWISFKSFIEHLIQSKMLCCIILIETLWARNYFPHDFSISSVSCVIIRNERYNYKKCQWVFLSQEFWKDAGSKIEKTLFVASFLWIYRSTRTKEMGLEVNLVHFLGFRCTGNVHNPGRFKLQDCITYHKTLKLCFGLSSHLRY